MFVDSVTVEIAAGDGGRGALSFRHEKFIDRGGPDGGDGGKGGDVVFRASRNENTLAVFRYNKSVAAQPGTAGSKQRKHGRNGKDVIVKVPIGTMITSLETGDTLADLTEDGQQAVIAQGGRGGFGNAHFVSSRRQAPMFAEKGDPGQQLQAKLELKMIADVGLVGLPNAGKSTLLSRISNARPEIADYPFTTLTPNLGVVDAGERSLLVADIPGLIEGAAEGKGLGHAFLRHIERTAVLVHLIDAYNQDIAAAYTTVKQELRQHEASLASRPEIVVLTKVEGLGPADIESLHAQLRAVVPKSAQQLAISSQSGAGLAELRASMKAAVMRARRKVTRAKPEDTIPTIRLRNTDADWHVAKTGKGFVVTGKKIEQFAVRTDFANEEAVQRLQDIMRKMGILHELSRQGAEAGVKIQVGTNGSTLSF